MPFNVPITHIYRFAIVPLDGDLEGASLGLLPARIKLRLQLLAALDPRGGGEHGDDLAGPPLEHLSGGAVHDGHLQAVEMYFFLHFDSKMRLKYGMILT